MIRSVTVYCSSSREIKPAYLAAAHELGHAIASAGWTLVYGGNYLGSMAAVADGARSAKGTVIGITPRLMVGKGYDDKLCTELIVVDDMRQRKALLESRGDALVALPGGLGTLEELSEVIVGRVLKYHDKPIVILNIDGFYDPLLAFIEQGIKEKFVKPRARDLYFVATTIPAAIAHLKHAHPRPCAAAGAGARAGAGAAAGAGASAGEDDGVGAVAGAVVGADASAVAGESANTAPPPGTIAAIDPS